MQSYALDLPHICTNISSISTPYFATKSTHTDPPCLLLVKVWKLSSNPHKKNHILVAGVTQAGQLNNWVIFPRTTKQIQKNDPHPPTKAKAKQRHLCLSVFYSPNHFLFTTSEPKTDSSLHFLIQGLNPKPISQILCFNHFRAQKYKICYTFDFLFKKLFCWPRFADIPACHFLGWFIIENPECGCWSYYFIKL